MIALALTVSILPMSPGPSPIERTRFEPSSAIARAEARVRIISGASIKLGRLPNAAEARLRSVIILIEGEPHSAHLIEFP